MHSIGFFKFRQDDPIIVKQIENGFLGVILYLFDLPTNSLQLSFIKYGTLP